MNRVDGIIIPSQMTEWYIAAIASRIKNRVFLDFYSETDGYGCVLSNNFPGSYTLTKLLVAAAHMRRGVIGSTSAATGILDRYMGFRKAMPEAPLPYNAAIKDRDANGVYIEIKLQPDAYTAYVYNNDQIAGVAIVRLRDINLKVPCCISIVGSDNENGAVAAGIGVTSLEFNVQDMRATAIDQLIERVESKSYRLRGKRFIDGRVVGRDKAIHSRSSEMTRCRKRRAWRFAAL
ncbi:MAG: substrate-binding domain-containing protein [Treponema sp.]|jgi:LacI family transcriptional regulator|nr:substrate-binding domain-containing protein [Treponema sp.]